MSDLAQFSLQLIRRPRQVSALAPSSQALCRLMAAQIPPNARRVAEFGPGTGSITRAILESGIAPADLCLFEINPEFSRHLRRTFPLVTVIDGPAQDLATFPGEAFDAVVSGLPLLSMRPETQQAIVGAAFSRLSTHGAYIQFTYGPMPPLREAIACRLGLIWTRTRRVWLNLPPATVYVYRRNRAAGPPAVAG